VDFVNFAKDDPQFCAQIEFFIMYWQLVMPLTKASKTASGANSLLKKDEIRGVRFDDPELWDVKVDNLKRAMKENEKGVGATVIRGYINDSDIVGRAYGEEQKQRFRKLAEPVGQCSTKLRYLKVLLAFSKGEHVHSEQASPLEQPTQHPNAVSLGSKRASEQSIGPGSKKQRFEGTGDFARPLQDDSGRQGHCTAESGPLLLEQTYFPNETSPPNQTPSHDKLRRLQYISEEAIHGTSDTRVRYR